METPCFCTKLRFAGRKLSALYDAALEPLGINIAQHFLLRTINRHDAVSLTELGRLAELDRSTIGRNVRVLKRTGLLQTARSKDDQREAKISLTQRGKDLVRTAEPIWDRCQEDFARRLGPGKIQDLAVLLAAI